MRKRTPFFLFSSYRTATANTLSDTFTKSVRRTLTPMHENETPKEFCRTAKEKIITPIYSGSSQFNENQPSAKSGILLVKTNRTKSE